MGFGFEASRDVENRTLQMLLLWGIRDKNVVFDDYWAGVVAGGGVYGWTTLKPMPGSLVSLRR